MVRVTLTYTSVPSFSTTPNPNNLSTPHRVAQRKKILVYFSPDKTIPEI